MLTSPRTNTLTSFLLLCFAALGTVALGLMALPGLPAGSPLLTEPPVVSAPAGGVYEARLAKGTEGQLRQVALHLSNTSTALSTRMNGGESVGGFPGFEPPEDDEEYRRKIKDRSYTPEEANHWVKETNGFLKWIMADCGNLLGGTQACRWRRCYRDKD